MKKILSFLLITASLIGFASCSQSAGSGVPNGMKIATAAGADFRLYVPVTWNLNTEFGISGAYYSLDRQSTVSVTKYQISESDTVDTFFQSRLLPELIALSVENSVKNVEDPTATTLDALNAKRYHLTALTGGITLHATYVIGEGNGSFYVFSALICEELYDVLLPSVESMLENFKLAEPYVPDEYARKIDGKVACPDGMTLASGEDVSYRFFVPNTWKIDKDERISSGIFEEDRSTVSVVPYMPDTDNMTVDEFLTMREKELKITFSPTDRTVGNRPGKTVAYTYTIGGQTYQYLQAVVSYRGMIYCITYTATPTAFGSHLGDVDRMIDEFRFR